MIQILNLIPGYPLDGGRVLRAAIWWVTGNMERSTRIASLVGQSFAFFFILAGLWRFFTGHGFAGLWIAFIGWFLLDASRSSYAQTVLLHVLRGLKVCDVMDRNCTPVDANITLQALVDEHSIPTGTRCFVVQKNGYLAGLITTADIGRIGRDQWPVTPVEQAMRPVDKLHTVSPNTAVAQALETMARENINQLPVVSDCHVEGILSRAHLLQVLRTRAELKM